MISIIYFILVCFFLGFSSLYFLKKPKDLFELAILSIIIGLGIWIVLTVILNTFFIPVIWYIPLILGLIIPSYHLIKHKKISVSKKDFKMNDSLWIKCSLIILFLFSIMMYSGGALNHDYLENWDPYRHAESSKYVSLEQTLKTDENNNFNYLNPYPPGFAIVMGTLNQINPSLNWTLKFFNGFILAIGILFSFFVFKKILPNEYYALFSTFLLVMIPSFFTRFIWAQGIAIMLFFPLIYALFEIEKDKKWYIIISLLIAAIFLTQPTKMIKIFGLISVYWLIKVVIEKKINWELIGSFVFGAVLSLFWWIDKWQGMLNRGIRNVGEEHTTNLNLFERILSVIPPDSGSATRVYTFNDFFIAKKFGMINVQIGWGVFVSVLLLLGLIYLVINYKKLFSKKGKWETVILIWFFLTFIFSNSMTFNLPIGLMSFRTWLLMAIPVAIISSYGLQLIIINRKKFPLIFIILFFVIGVWFTAGTQKYFHNTQTNWPPGEDWSSNEQREGFSEMKNLMTNKKVYTLCGKDKLVISFDQISYSWKKGIKDFRKNLNDISIEKINRFLTEHEYEYLIIDSDCVEIMDVEKINLLLTEIIQNENYSLVINNDAFFLLKFNQTP